MHGSGLHRKDKNDDKRKIFDRTLEQLAYVGAGASGFDLCCCRFFWLDMDGKRGNDRAIDYWGALLTGSRRAYLHAVRMASGKQSKL